MSLHFIRFQLKLNYKHYLWKYNNNNSIKTSRIKNGYQRKTSSRCTCMVKSFYITKPSFWKKGLSTN